MSRVRYVNIGIDRATGDIAVHRLGCEVLLLRPAEAEKLRENLAAAIAVSLAERGMWDDTSA